MWSVMLCDLVATFIFLLMWSGAVWFWHMSGDDGCVVSCVVVSRRTPLMTQSDELVGMVVLLLLLDCRNRQGILQ